MFTSAIFLVLPCDATKDFGLHLFGLAADFVNCGGLYHSLLCPTETPFKVQPKINCERNDIRALHKLRSISCSHVVSFAYGRGMFNINLNQFVMQ